MRCLGSLLSFGLLAILVNAQTPLNRDEVTRIGPGVTPPKLLQKAEPEYSAEARENNIQGTVIFELVINEQGNPVDITVMSPLGFGLDEKAQAAIEKWRFAPGIKNGVPVKVLAQVEVNFRLLNRSFDQKAERRRSEFNLAQQVLANSGSTPARTEKAVMTILDLAKQKFTAAMYQVGVWKCSGEHGPKDCTEGLDLIQKAAAKNYGPAIYELGIRRIEGRELPQEAEKGLQELRTAATLGSRQAQFYLGNRYANGDGVPRDPDRARRYFRLCAAQGVGICQYRLGRLLYELPGRRERDLMQAIALFQLAAEQGMEEARKMVSDETASLTPEQNGWVANLKRQIVRK